MVNGNFQQLLLAQEANLFGGWTNPSEKYDCSQNGFLFPEVRGENERMFELPPPRKKQDILDKLRWNSKMMGLGKGGLIENMAILGYPVN